MAMTIERETFEAAMRQGKGFSEHLLARDGRNPDYYGNHIVQAAWEGWNARAHLTQTAPEVNGPCVTSEAQLSVLPTPPTDGEG